MQLCDKIIVHDVSDLNRLKSINVIDNLALIPHGVLKQKNVDKYKNKTNIKIASFGFFLPYKGFLELIEAFNLVSSDDNFIELYMYNAEYPSESSNKIIKLAKEKIEKCSNKNKIYLDTNFYSDKDTIDNLNDKDIIIYPYQRSSESASGAVRFGIISNAITLTTPLNVFNNVKEAVIYMRGFDPISISKDILKYSKYIRENNINLQKYKDKKNIWIDSNSYQTIGYQYINMIKSIHLNKKLD